MSEPKPLLPPVKPATTDPKLWKGGVFQADPWHVIASDAPIPANGQSIIDIERWRRERDQVRALGVPIGVLVGSVNEIEPANEDLAGVSLVALAFPKFGDGRAYSQARRLRERGFKGEIRAVGDVLLDQIPLMLRSGFDAFQITHVATIRELQNGRLPAVPHVYQADEVAAAETAWRRRGS